MSQNLLEIDFNNKTRRSFGGAEASNPILIINSISTLLEIASFDIGL